MVSSAAVTAELAIEEEVMRARKASLEVVGMSKALAQ